MKKHFYNKAGHNLANVAIKDIGFRWFGDREKDQFYSKLWKKVFQNSFTNIQEIRGTLEVYRGMDYEET